MARRTLKKPHLRRSARPRIGARLGMRSWLAVCVLLLVWLTGCNRQKEGEEAVAWVNGDPILFSVFWEELKSRYNEDGTGETPQRDVLDALKKSTLSDLIRERLLLQEAAKRGLSVTEAQVEARLREIRQGYEGGWVDRDLVKHSQDLERWRRNVRKGMILEALFEEVVRNAEGVTPEEVRDYYDHHPDEFLIPATVSLSQIVVKEEKLARSLLRSLKKGEDFGELARLYSISPEKEEGGHLGVFRRGELLEPLEEAAFSAPAGSLAPLVETDYGYHLLRVDSSTPAHVAPFEEVRGRIRARLMEEKQEAYHAHWLDQLIRNADIRVQGPLMHLMLEKETDHAIPRREPSGPPARPEP